MSKRILSGLLAILLVLQSVVMPVYAEGSTSVEVSTEEAVTVVDEANDAVGTTSAVESNSSEVDETLFAETTEEEVGETAETEEESEGVQVGETDVEESSVEEATTTEELMTTETEEYSSEEITSEEIMMTVEETTSEETTELSTEELSGEIKINSAETKMDSVQLYQAADNAINVQLTAMNKKGTELTVREVAIIEAKATKGAFTLAYDDTAGCYKLSVKDVSKLKKNKTYTIKMNVWTENQADNEKPTVVSIKVKVK